MLRSQAVCLDPGIEAKKLQEGGQKRRQENRAHRRKRVTKACEKRVDFGLCRGKLEAKME